MAELHSSNPAFTRSGFGQTRSPVPPPPPGSWQPGPWPQGPGFPPAPPAPPRGGLTFDDVVMHTLGVFAVMLVGAGVGWYLSPDSPSIALGAAVAALALSLVISFRSRISPPLVVLFAALEGLFVGGVSRFYESAFSGIVLQALLGTALVFVAMLAAYRSGRLRATPRMARIITGTLLGVVLLGITDLVVRAVSGSHLPIINDASPLGILFSVAVLAVASLQFILDFDYIERAVANGAPREEAWRAAFGLLVGFVWVYLELLRLLSKLRQ
ncbi:hypothetical protein CC117_06100 [Parafrankia colletiae]|uniref:Bax inhibitor-1/YccA family protein n=1 Tax=Parafrankia colletiae TaxID=573497 RepID=A0A1S1QBC0_9ACTN|nr:Bax inhibitor-1/YccA family protein [Parafrankia colletiae]MCK9900343.1 Bax inhibitor-1/YccA family protein [Frankia sp. Cpl3]OHV30515.1 hypothetical protein CC117_06100 [Parafrankia colletiae]